MTRLKAWFKLLKLECELRIARVKKWYLTQRLKVLQWKIQKLENYELLAESKDFRENNE